MASRRRKKKSVTDEMADGVIAHEVDLQRLTTAESNAAVKLLEDLSKDLKKKVRKASPTTESGVRRQRKLKTLLTQSEETIRAHYKKINTSHKAMLTDLASASADTVEAVMNGVLESSLVSTALTPTQLKTIASDTLIQGAPSSEWWGRQAGSLRDRFSDQMRLAFLQGESVRQMSTRVTSMVDVSKREADALVRTSVQTVSNEARLETYRQNSDVIKGVEALATLDTRTSAICQARDGGAWSLETGEPLPKSTINESFPGSPPWHWNCRTVLIPITKTFEELGAGKKREVPDSVRASMDGDVSASLSYNEWLRRQPKSTQVEALGPTKWHAWKKGGVTLQQMVDQTGRPLSVGEIVDKIPDFKISIPAGARTTTGKFRRELGFGTEAKLNSEVRRWQKAADSGSSVTLKNNAVSRQPKAANSDYVLEQEFSGTAFVVNERKGQLGFAQDSKFVVTKVETTQRGYRVFYDQVVDDIPKPPARIPKPKVETTISPNGQSVTVPLSRVAAEDSVASIHSTFAQFARDSATEKSNVLKKASESLSAAGMDPRLASKSRFSIRMGGGRAENVHGQYLWSDSDIPSLSFKAAGKDRTRLFLHEFGHHLDYNFLNSAKGAHSLNGVNRDIASSLRKQMVDEYREALVSNWNTVAKEKGWPLTNLKEVRRLRRKPGGVLGGLDDLAELKNVDPDDAYWAIEDLPTSKRTSAYSLVNDREWIAENFTELTSSPRSASLAFKRSPKTQEALKRLLAGETLE